MIFNGTTRILQEGVDVARLVRFCASLSESDWSEWDFRQNTYEVHKNTQTYPFLWDVAPEKKKNMIGWDLVSPHIEFLESEFSGRCTKAMLARLTSGTGISEHSDGGQLADIHRCHLPIISGALVDFVVDGQPNTLSVGKWYELNNQLRHSVFNGEPVDRVHFIVDIKPNDKEYLL